MTVYRKKVNSDTWHWCTNCSNWPTGKHDVDYIQESFEGRPTSGELDNQCLSKERDGECIKA